LASSPYAASAGSYIKNSFWYYAGAVQCHALSIQG